MVHSLTKIQIGRRVRTPGILLVSCFLLLFIGCTASRIQTRLPLEEQGAIYMYMKPFPPEADRLAFTFARVAAVKDNGEDIPLSLNFTELSSPTVSRERLLAFGELPTGQYRGFLFQVQKASLRGEEGNAALQLSEEASRVEMPFFRKGLETKASWI